MSCLPPERFGRWVVFGLILVCTGCVTTYSYPDPKYGRYDLSLGDLRGVPARIAVDATYAVNDRPNSASAEDLRERVTRILQRKTGIEVVPAAHASGPKTTLMVSVDHRYSRDTARNAGIATGLSLGAVKRSVRDRFRVSVALLAPSDGAERRADETGVYPQAIVTALGHPKADVRQGDYSDAMDRVLEHVLARFFADRAARREVTEPIIFLPDEKTGAAPGSASDQ